MQITTTTTNRLHTLVLNDDEFATIEQALNDITDDRAYDADRAPVAWALWRKTSEVLNDFDIEAGAR